MAPPYKPTKGPPLAPVLTAAGRATIAARQKAAAVAKQQASARAGQLNLGDTSGPSLATGGAPASYPAPMDNPWAGAGATATLTKGVTKTVTPAHPLAHPPPAKPKPVVTHPHTIRVTPGPVGTDASSSGSRDQGSWVAGSPPPPKATPYSAPAAPKVDLGKNGFFTTKAAAQKALPPDVPGSVVKFTKGKGYYIADSGRAPQGKKGGKPGGAAGAASSLEDQINAALKAELDPQTAAINSGYGEVLAELRAQQTKAQMDAAAQAATTRGYYGALTPLLQGIAPAVQGGYQDAANAVAGYAKGFSGSLGDTAAADAARSAQLLGENAAPQAQVDAAAQAAGAGGGAANALYGLGGYIPSAELSAQGAAAGAAARQLPATYAGIGAQNVAQALGVGQQNVADIGTKVTAAALKHANDLATLAAGVPKARNDLTSQFQTAAARQEDLAMKRRQQEFQNIIATGIDPLTGQLTPSARAQIAGITGVDPTTNQPTIETRKAAAAQARDAAAAARASRSLDLTTMRTLSQITGVVYGPDGQPQLDAQGKPVLTPAGQRAATAAYKASRPASKGGFTKAQLASISKSSEHNADVQYNGVLDTKQSTPTTPVFKTLPIQDYQQALKQQLAAGVPLQVAQRSLNAFWQPGEHGRPYVPIQARVRLEQAGLPMQDPLAPPTAQQAAWMQAHGISWSR